MTKEHWENNMFEFSSIVSSIFTAHDIKHSLRFGNKNAEISTDDNSIDFCMDKDGFCIAFFYKCEYDDDFCSIAKFLGDDVYEAAIGCSHMIKIREFNTMPPENYDCEYCTARNYD